MTKPANCYMNKEMLIRFSGILVALRESTKHHDSNLSDVDYGRMPDELDMASQKEMAMKLARQTRMANETIRSINRAMDRIHDGEYGYCTECGCEIGEKRLGAQPYADMCILCKEAEEIKGRQYRGD